jgi:hypothetical protein
VQQRAAAGVAAFDGIYSLIVLDTHAVQLQL